MAKRSERIQELRENNEVSCMSGLFSIQCPQGCSSPQLISDGRAANKPIVGLTSSTANARQRSLRDLIQDDMHIGKKKNKNKQIMDKRQQCTEADSKLINHLLETQKAARKKFNKSYHSPFCHLNNLGRSIHQQPSTSAEMSLNRLAIGAALGTVCSQNHQQEVRLCEGYRRSIIPGKHGLVDEKNMQQTRMSATDSDDQMFADSKFICNETTRIKSKPFSNALEVLNTDKDQDMELLSEPCSQLEKCIENFRTSQTEIETVKSVPNANFSKCESQDKMEKVTAELQSRKYSGKFVRHGSTRQSRDGLSRRASNGKLTCFSVRDLDKILKHTFGGTRKEPNQFSICGTSSKLPHNRSIFGDDCIYRGVNARNPLSFSTNTKTKEKLGNRQGLKLERKPCDTVREKIDFSSSRFSEKHGVYTVLEANRRISAGLKDLNAIGKTSERSPKTLERIISSLQHDFWPLSPRRESRYCPSSGQMRFISYITSQTPNERQRTCLSPIRTNTEVTPRDDNYRISGTETSSSLIPSNDEGAAQDTTSSAAGNMKSDDEPNVVETNNIHNPEAPYKRNESSDKVELAKEDGSVMHFRPDALSDNETSTNTADDFPSTPTSIHQLDMSESSKCQEEHQSPVSVLDQFFLEDADSPSGSMLQPARNPLKPQRLHFEECSFHSSPQDEQDYISHYVNSVFQASSLNWDRLSKIRPLSEELLDSSLFDEVVFRLPDSHIDTRLLFDHMNEVLLQIQRSHFLSPLWSEIVKPRICSVPLKQLVLDEIMREADFYLLPRTQKRTLDQLVAKDVPGSRFWPDFRLETEHIMIQISEDIMEESILDVILELHC